MEHTLAATLTVILAAVILALAHWVMVPRWDRDPGKRIYFYAVGVAVIGTSLSILALIYDWPAAIIAWVWGIIAVAGVTTLVVRLIRNYIDYHDKDIAQKAADAPRSDS